MGDIAKTDASNLWNSTKLRTPIADAFKRLKDIGKTAAPKQGRIVIIPKDQFKIACTNVDFHGHANTTICFRPGLIVNKKVVKKPVDEHTCECGIVYKQEK